MREELLPLFPLAVVLLPGNRLPLHIFEDRYKEMVGKAIEDHSEFGVVLAAQGGIASAGCTATVDEVAKQYEDGRFDVIVTGRRRFHLEALDQELSVLRGDVQYFGDEPGEAPPELRTRALTACERLESDEQQPFEENDPLLSFRLAQRFNDLMFRQRLLMMRTEEERLSSIIEYAPSYSDRLRNAAHMRQLANRNGHSHKPPEFDQ